jgi:hypothetical protein
MSVPATYYVNVSVSLSAGAAPQAGFGTALFLNDHSTVDSDPVLGPFTSPAEVLDAGFASGSPFHNFATAYSQQSPRATSIYSGLYNGSNVATSLDACEAANPAAGYGIATELRDSTSILALADWVESRKRIAMVQSNDASILAGTGPTYSVLVGGTATDGTYILTFTGFGLASPVPVTVTRAAGTPATNDLIGDEFRTALTTAAGGSLSGEIVTASIGGTGATVTFRMTDGLLGTVTASGTAVAGAGDLTVTVTDADIASALFAGQYTRTALWYYATDADMLAERVLARGLGYDLDTEQGQWSWRQLFGISASTDVNGTTAAAIRAVNANYFATAQMDVGGALTTPFTFPGRFPVGSSALGRRISTTVSLDYMHARLQEALLSVLLQSSHGVLFDNNGIGLFDAVTKDALDKFVKRKHITRLTIPAGEEDAGRESPFADWPKASAITSAVKATGVLTATRAVAHIAQSIDRVIFSLEARQ